MEPVPPLPKKDADGVPAAAGFAPVFRAVNTPRQRRGIRLEAIYWEGLKDLAADAGRSVGEIVEDVVDTAPGESNLASLLRVRVVGWLSDRLRRLEALTEPDATDAIIQASPSPAFVLTADKKILFYNRAFLNLIQSRFVTIRPDAMQKGLRLSLDTQLDQVIESLRGGSAATVVSGFAIGVEERRIRGSVNLVLAPVRRQAMVIAFVTAA